MELNFTKVSESQGYWEALATVNKDFSLHIERESKGQIKIDLSSIQDTQYMDDKFSISADKVYDDDFAFRVYPKYIRIRSYSEPTLGVIVESTN